MDTEKEQIGDFNFYSLWPTNLMVRRINEGAAFNAELAETARGFHAEHFSKNSLFPYRSDSACLFSSVRSPALGKLFHHVQESAYIYLNQFYPKVELPRTELLFTSFVNVQDKETLWVNPHAHVESQFVVTYYCHVNFGSRENPRTMPGALNFHDHRSLMANWMMRQENKMFTMELSAGTMVVFPGYVKHSTYPLFDETSSKIAIVTNVRMRDRGDAYQGIVRTASEILAWQNGAGAIQGEMKDVR